MTDGNTDARATSEGSSAVQGDRAASQAFLEQGLNHHDRGELAEALACYQKAQEADPSFALAFNNAGMVLIDLEQYEDAVGHLNMALQIDPEHAEAYNNLGFVLRRLHRDQESADAYERFITLEPDVEEAPRIRQWVEMIRAEQAAAAAGQQAQPESAAAAEQPPPAEAPPIPPEAPPEQAPADQAPPVEAPPAQVPPQEAPAEQPAPMAEAEAAPPVEPPAEAPAQIPATVKAPVEERTAEEAPVSAGEAPQAVEPTVGAQTIVEAPPAESPPVPPAEGAAPGGNVEEICEAALDKFGDAQFPEAEALFAQALTIDPNHAPSRAGMGKVLVREEKYEQGIAELNAAIQLEPNDPGSYYVLGYALRAIGDDAGAANAYDRFLTLMPEAEDAEKIRSWVAYARGTVEKEQALDAAVDSQVEAAVVETASGKKYHEALSRFQGGDSEGAMRTCQIILREDPGHVATHVLMGRIAIRGRDLNSAVFSLQQALAVSPDYAEALYFLAQAYEKCGKQAEAQQSYRKYLEIAPNGPRAERIKELLQAEQPAAAISVIKGQCALCLRYFEEPELYEYEGSRACRQCLATIEAQTGKRILPVAPTENNLIQAPPELSLEAGGAGGAAAAGAGEAPAVAAAPRRTLLYAAAAIVGLIAIGAGVVLSSGGVTPFLRRIGLAKPPPEVPVDPGPGPDPKDVKPVPPPPLPATFDPAKVKIVGDPPTDAMPWRKYLYEPKLEGVDAVTVQVELKKGPPGVIVSDKPPSVSWTYRPDEVESLATPVQFPVELVIKGIGKGPDEGKVLFEKPLSFNIRVRFAFVATESYDTGIPDTDDFLIAIADVTGDGKADAILANGRYRRGEVRVFPNPGGGWPQPKVIPIDGQPVALATADVNRDNRTDIVVADWYNSDVCIVLQTPEGGVAPGLRFRTGRGVAALAAADLTGDGLADVVTANLYNASVSVHARMSGDKLLFGPPLPMPAGQGSPIARVFPWPTPAEAKAVLLFGGTAPDARVKFFPLADGKLKAYTGSPLEGNAIGLDAVPVRFDPETPPALAVLCGGKEPELRMLYQSENTFSRAGKNGTEEPVKVQALGQALRMAAGDLNGDGRDDVVVFCSQGVILYIRDNNRFVEVQRWDMPGVSGIGAIGDVNGDGRPDIVVTMADRRVKIFASQP